MKILTDQQFMANTFVKDIDNEIGADRRIHRLMDFVVNKISQSNNKFADNFIYLTENYLDYFDEQRIAILLNGCCLPWTMSMINKKFNTPKQASIILSQYIEEARDKTSPYICSSLLNKYKADPTVESFGLFNKLCKFGDANSIKYCVNNYDIDINCRDSMPLLLASKFNSKDAISAIILLGGIPGNKANVITKILAKRGIPYNFNTESR